MTQRKNPKAFAVVDVDGSFLVFPSNSETAVLKEARERWGDHTFKATTFVPADPAAAAVVRAAVKYAEAVRAWHAGGAYVSQFVKTEKALRAAVEKMQRKGKR